MCGRRQPRLFTRPLALPPLPSPAATGKGGKNRRRGKADGDNKRELIFKEDGQEYAQVVRMLGNGRLEALCFDGKTRLAIIRGKMRKKVWVNQGDIILLGLRDFQDDKAVIQNRGKQGANIRSRELLEQALARRIAPNTHGLLL